MRKGLAAKAIGTAGPALLVLSLADPAFAHDVAHGDRGFIEATSGVRLAAFFYLGAKHMVTGYDHLLFLFGVIFYLYQFRQIALYVTLFAIGHSTTLILGVLLGTHFSPYLVDAVIGLSVAYKGLENMGAFPVWFGIKPDNRVVVAGFGLVHGLGLATKLQDLGLAKDGLLPNLVAFNLGVETGQLLALTAILIAMGYWRQTASFTRHAFAANVLLVAIGFVLFGQHLAGYFVEKM